MKEFEHLTIGEIEELTKQYRINNPDVKSSGELLEELNDK